MSEHNQYRTKVKTVNTAPFMLPNPGNPAEKKEVYASFRAVYITKDEDVEQLLTFLAAGSNLIALINTPNMQGTESAWGDAVAVAVVQSVQPTKITSASK